jgi:viroplasmin and RNaseH domain-containing protein
MYVTNSTYAYFSMKNGDQFAKKFGAGDWFKLAIKGKDAAGNDTQALEVYLADFRNGKSELLNQWKWVDLMGLGAVKSIHFELSSTDNGDWGMNTPSYFCLDDITAMISE